MIEFLKIRNVKSPQRRFGDAGIDCFIPEFDDDFKTRFYEINDDCIIRDNKIIMKSNEVLIPLGLKAKFDSDVALLALNKSGIATKFKLSVGAGVVDSSYQGEIHAHLFKRINKEIELNSGMKITQFVPIKIDTDNVVIKNAISSDEFYGGIKTSRSDKGFGSTGI